MDTSVKRGDIYYADLSPVVGSEQGGVRPVLIIQNDTGNRYSPTVIAAAITSQTGKARLPTHIDLPVDQSCGLSRDSVVLLEQVRTLDLIIQNDTGNRYSPTVIAAAITSQTGKARLPTHIDLPVDQSCGLSRDSVVLLEQVRTLDKRRLRERMGHVEERVMEKVDLAIAVSFGLPHEQLV